MDMDECLKTGADLELTVSTFSELTGRDVYEILKARSAVFVVEQNCVYQDMDDIDYTGVHVFYKKRGRVAAYLRIFERDRAEGVMQIGRVLTTERGTGLGLDIITAGIGVAKQKLQARKILIEAQSYAIRFYERVGFRQVSDEFLEDGIPHVRMLLE